MKGKIKKRKKGPTPVTSTQGETTGKMAGVGVGLILAGPIGGVVGYLGARSAFPPIKTYEINSKQQQKLIDAESRRIYKKNFPMLTKSEQRRILKFLSKKYGTKKKV
jgi:hypothetical protein